MTFVILTAGIDLSIGSLVAFAGLVAAAVSKGGISNRFTVGAGQEAASYGWYLAALAAIARRARRRICSGLCHHPTEGPAVCRHARRHVGLPRRRAAFRCWRADQRLRTEFRLDGPGAYPRSGAGTGRHFPRLCGACPCRAPLHTLRPPGLCRRWQPGSGAALGVERPRRDHQRLCHHGLLCRTWRLRAYRPG